MHSLAAPSRRPAGPSLADRTRIAIAAGALLLALPFAARAQVELTHTEDASPVPAGMLRFRATTGWTRFDERFIAGGRRTLGDEISAADFGPQQLPLLAPVQAGLQTLTGDAMTRLSLGHLAVYSDARTVTTPIVLEYGVTRRLSIGLLVPIVQTRRAVSVRVNTDSNSSANVGYLPSRLRSAAASQNAAVYAAYTKAADSIATLVSKCPANPSASGCAAVNLNPGDATSAGAQARQFADALRQSLGTDTTTTIVAPRTGSSLATSIDAQRAAINARVQKYLGTTAGASTNVFLQSSPFSYVDLQGRNGVGGLLKSALGGGLDSLQTTNKLALGGATFGAQFMVFDHFLSDTVSTAHVQTRLAVGAGFRYEALPADSARTLGVVAPSSGSAVEFKGAMDVITGNLGGTLAAHYTKFLAHTVDAPLSGDPITFWPIPGFGPAQLTSGAILAIDVTPRLLLGNSFALDAHYGLEHTAAPAYDRSTLVCTSCVSQTAHRLGLGVRYSTVDAYLRGVHTVPVEVSFTHLQTVAGSDGVAAIQRDQVQVRYFFTIRGRR
ncbi:MAG: hypothetical protein ABJA80_14620 [bacterium]